MIGGRCIQLIMANKIKWKEILDMMFHQLLRNNFEFLPSSPDTWFVGS